MIIEKKKLKNYVFEIIEVVFFGYYCWGINFNCVGFFLCVLIGDCLWVVDCWCVNGLYSVVEGIW